MQFQQLALQIGKVSLVFDEKHFLVVAYFQSSHCRHLENAGCPDESRSRIDLIWNDDPWDLSWNRKTRWSCLGLLMIFHDCFVEIACLLFFHTMLLLLESEELDVAGVLLSFSMVHYRGELPWPER